VRRTLALSTGEGMAAEVVGACAGSAVLTAWALALGAGPVWLGLLGALPFLSQLIHLPSAWITSRLGRRRTAILAVTASRQTLLLLAPLPWLPVRPEHRLLVLLAVAGASSALGVVGNNAWTAWMGDLVPARLRGRYFGRRTALCTVAGMVASLGAGLALDRSGRIAPSGVALAGLALAASAAGAVTTWLMVKQHEPARADRFAAPRLADAFHPLRDPAARSALVFIAAWNAAIGISGAFFSVHLLGNLKLGYTLVALLSAGAAVARILSVPLWGRALDRLGARPVLVTCTFGLAAAPIFWILPTEACPWPIAFDALLSGTLLAGHALASFALPLSLAPRSERPFYLATFSATGGLAYALASAAGGALASALPARFVLWGHPSHGLHLLFVISAVGRLGSGWLALRIREPGARPARELRAVAEGALADLREKLNWLFR
jgi:MFS family permease